MSEPARPAPSALRTLTLTALALLCFAANSLLCRAALSGGHTDAASFTLMRLASGAVVLALLGRVRRSPSPPSGMAWGSALALFAYAIGFSLAYVRIAAGVGALILFASVQFTMIGAGLFGGERPHVREWVGLVISMVGLVVLTRPGLASPDPLGAALMVGAGLSWGVYSLRGRRSADAVGGNAASFARAMLLAIPASIIAIVLGATHLEPRGTFLALLSGAITSGLGYVVWYAALRGLTTTRAAVIQLAVPVVSATGGVLVLGEQFSARLGLAGILILGGIGLAALRPNRR